MQLQECSVVRTSEPVVRSSHAPVQTSAQLVTAMPAAQTAWLPIEDEKEAQHL